MSSFSVLLESYSRLPQTVLAEPVSDILGAHIVDATRQLRVQQGIVWENLDRFQATALASLLMQKGFPAGLVPQEDVVLLQNQWSCTNADILETGLVLEDPFGNNRVLGPDWFELAQAGWVRERRRPYRERMTTRIRSQSGPRRDIGHYFKRVKKPGTEPSGWILNLFGHGDPPEWIQIRAWSFNYDYLAETPPGWMEGFKHLVNDLAKLIPEHRRDRGFRLALALGLRDSVPDDARFTGIRSLAERGRWALTILRTVGKFR